MLKFLNRKKREATFKKNVAEFWDWFSKNASNIYDKLQNGEAADLTDDMIRQINKLMPGMAWCFGPGKKEGYFSFTLSPEANRNLQFLSTFWKELAPEIPKWEFYSSKQPSPEPESFTISIKDRDFSLNEMWLKPEKDETNQVFDISVWHPHFHEMDDNSRYQILFLWLDEVLGELGTEQWIGQVDFSHEEFDKAIPLLELPEYIEIQKEKNDWKKPPPENAYSLYEINLSPDAFPRSDTKFGNTCNMQLVGDYFETKGDLPNLLAGSQAEYVYLSFPTCFLPSGDEINARTKIEDELNQLLIENKTGRCIGSAFGSENNYIDFIIFDGIESLEILINGILNCNLPTGSEVHFWAAENKDSYTV
ncbi:MAG: hypothetical protein NE327_20290 [Lentisphaeraceae bacterium]|nr:hypothetical protein [Lentisphaeraceae bacterium]